MGMYKLNLVRTNVIPIVNFAWNKSFAKTSSNLKAICDRDWGPLNKVLLHHIEIKSSKPACSIHDSPPRLSPGTSPRSSPTPMPPRPLMKKDVIDVKDLNFNEGFTGDVIQTILRRAQRDQQTLNNLRKTKKIGSDFISFMQVTKLPADHTLG